MTTRRFIQMPDGELVEVERDYVGPGGRQCVPVIGDRHYDGLRASDGANISTRTKHREYMKRTGLATIDDFSGEFQKKADERRRFYTEGYDPSRKPMIRDAVNRIYERGKR